MTIRQASCALWILAAAFGAARAQSGAATSCVSCHRNPDYFDEASIKAVTDFLADVHAESGLSCHDCHGGNPDPKLSEDAEAAMDAKFRPHPFKPSPARTEIPAFCGQCHSNPTYMKRFKPDIRVDQEREYWTSQHGQALRQGDTKVATCVDCHHAHGVLRAANPRSPVYPTRVADTCGHCHSDAAKMAGYKLPDGSPLPVHQVARWKQSVHANSLLVKEDLSAPTCNDCHGNHGAAPPGLESIAFVCGQCHGREADLFRKSGKHDGWQRHNEYLAEAGEQRCAACHEAPASAASVTDIHRFSECTSCHANHGIVRPTVAMFSSLPETPCAFCHEGQLAEEFQESKASRDKYVGLRDQLLEQARAEGLEGAAVFDYLVDIAQGLPVHTLEDGGEIDGKPATRPEFQRLFSKFRIGKTYYTYLDPVSGQEVKQTVVRCGHCHDEGNEATATGATRGQSFLDPMRALTSLTATAERTLLGAQRGGVETRDALTKVDMAVDAQIGLEVLVHTFNPEGAFADKQKEGVAAANAALESGHEALRELRSRRTGLFVSLFFIGLVLLGLGMKIRQISAT